MEQKVFLVFFMNLKCRLQIQELKGAVSSSYLPVSMVTRKPITLMPSNRTMHDDELLRQQPESFSLLFSCANQSYCSLILSGVTNLNKKVKTK